MFIYLLLWRLGVACLSGCWACPDCAFIRQSFILVVWDEHRFLRFGGEFGLVEPENGGFGGEFGGADPVGRCFGGGFEDADADGGRIHGNFGAADAGEGLSRGEFGAADTGRGGRERAE
jgi:hypothetical protein